MSVHLLETLITAVTKQTNKPKTPSKLTHEHFCQQLWPATPLPRNIIISFLFFHSLLQNIIDFVSFAIPQLHCRQYCLIRLPDYSSSEWKENGERTMTVLRSLRSAAEGNRFRNISRCWGINNLSDCTEVCEGLCLSPLITAQHHNWSHLQTHQHHFHILQKNWVMQSQ